MNHEAEWIKLPDGRVVRRALDGRTRIHESLTDARESARIDAAVEREIRRESSSEERSND